MADGSILLSQRVAAYASEINRLKAVAKLQRMQFGKLRKTSCKNRTADTGSTGANGSALQEEMAETLVSNMTRHCHPPCASLLPVNRYRPALPRETRATPVEGTLSCLWW
ncbi:hypothetical protein ACLB1E_36235 [Escherichia coli]